jgi:DNA-binding winged helix-turn-helix (wHTH) protein/tetratricopeptide (TPR) repeat protein
MSTYEFGPFHLDEERLLLFDRGEQIALGPKVVETLLALLEHPGVVMTKHALLDRIWPEGFVDEANLTQNVHVLRKTLRGRWEIEPIETIPRRGYRFNAQVIRREVPIAEPVTIAPAKRPRRALAVAASIAFIFGVIGAAAFLRDAHAAPDARLSADAQRMYTIGRYYWSQRTPDGLRKSVVYFARVIDEDPRSAQGYAAMADANAIMGDYAYGSARPATYFARAHAYAEKALTIDPNSADAYAVLGMLSGESSSKDDSAPAKAMSRGLAFFQRAIALDPKNASAREWYGVALLELGRVDAAYAQLRAASQLDPLSVATTDWLGMAAYLNRRYTEAIADERETLDLSPQRSGVYETLGLAYEAIGDMPHAQRAFDAFARDGHCRAEAAALLVEFYARTKQYAKARAELTIAQAHPRDVEPEDLAVALAAVGESRTALWWLHRVHSGEYLKMQIANDPRFNVLRKIIST